MIADHWPQRLGPADRGPDAWRGVTRRDATRRGAARRRPGSWPVIAGDAGPEPEPEERSPRPRPHGVRTGQSLNGKWVDPGKKSIEPNRGPVDAVPPARPPARPPR